MNENEDETNDEFVFPTSNGHIRFIVRPPPPPPQLPEIDFTLQTNNSFYQNPVYNEFLTPNMIINRLNNLEVDLVISDMAPNLSGNKAVDQPAMVYLAELALELAGKVLSSNGVFIAKLFQGQGFDVFVLEVRKLFNEVSIIKPDASRSRSREVYLMAKGLKAN